MHDDTLTPEERAALDTLPRDVTPSAALEGRVVAGLRRSGRLRPHWWRGAHVMRIAAAAILFAAGFLAARYTPGGRGDDAPQYLLVLYGGAAATADQVAARVAEYSAWARDEEAAGRLVLAEKLGAGRAVLGPESAAPPATGEPTGVFLIRASTLEAARAAAASNPHLRHGGTIVVRPIEKTD